MKNIIKQTRFTLLTGALVLGTLGFSQAANAEVILSDWFGSTESGYGQIAMERNDDGSSREFTFDEFEDLGFDSNVKFFGSDYDGFFINNNGNITFGREVGTFTPEPFPQSNAPMIAPFWADVDTRCDTCGNVYLGSPDANTLVVTWDAVGRYSNDATSTNTFQLVMIDRADTGSGNFDVEFRYGNIDWISGDASDGAPAQAGYDAGDQTNFFTVPGSNTQAVADLDIANSNTTTPGLWRFAIRDGVLPGSTPENPLMPVIDPENPTEYNFEFEVIDPDALIFIDPLVAVGYDYIVNSGPNLASVVLPTGFDDNMFDLWLWDATANDWYDANTVITGGVEYTFASALSRFRIMGIDVTNMVDPNDFTAFVTGLRFDAVGTINMNQNVVTFFVDDGSNPNVVSAPSIASLLVVLLAAGLVRRRKVI
jgi:hypothetical protein